jgi:hypothetical protein
MRFRAKWKPVRVKKTRQGAKQLRRPGRIGATTHFAGKKTADATRELAPTDRVTKM